MGALEDYVRSQRRTKNRADVMRDSVMRQPVGEQWQPEYERKGGHALEAPMISPEDLLMLGGPSALKALRNARLLGGSTGAIPIKEFERNAALFAPKQGERTLYHATDIPWEGVSPKPGTWFTTEPPRSGSPFGNTVRAYSVPEELLNGQPLQRGRGFNEALSGGKEPIAVIDDSGVTSYVVRDPSVLSRMVVKRPIRPAPELGSPRKPREIDIGYRKGGLVQMKENKCG